MSGGRGAYSALAIGGSAGSFVVIEAILESLPADCVLAVVLCMHTASRDVGDLCDVLATSCRLPVVEASERAPVSAGRVHVAAGDYHLLVEQSHHFSLCASDRVNYARPSIDVLFESMASVYRQALIGVLLSGANEDGAAGLARIRKLGGTTLVQTPESAQASAMPKAALASDAAARTGSPEQLARFIHDYASPG